VAFNIRELLRAQNPCALHPKILIHSSRTPEQSAELWYPMCSTTAISVLLRPTHLLLFLLLRHY
jgi:hypothetical protein